MPVRTLLPYYICTAENYQQCAGFTKRTGHIAQKEVGQGKLCSLGLLDQGCYTCHSIYRWRPSREPAQGGPRNRLNKATGQGNSEADINKSPSGNCGIKHVLSEPAENHLAEYHTENNSNHRNPKGNCRRKRKGEQKVGN